MFDQVSVLIPYQSDHGGPRDAALRWALDFYSRTMPGIEVCIGEVSGNPFSRSKAINRAARQATRDVFMIADCDIVYDPNLVLETISYVNDRQWVIPFSRILRLPEDISQMILSQTADWPIPTILGNRDENSAYYLGGLNALKRNAFDAVGDMMNGLSAGAGRMRPSHTQWTPLSVPTFDWTEKWCTSGTRLLVLKAIPIMKPTMPCTNNTRRQGGCSVYAQTDPQRLSVRARTGRRGYSMKLSVIVPVLNEETFVPLYIESVSRFAHEIIIVDGGSTDGTLKHIERLQDRYPIRLFRLQQNGMPYTDDWNESQVRNFLIDQAQGEWIMNLDIDELMDDRFQQALPELMANADVDIYQFPFVNFWEIRGPFE